MDLVQAEILAGHITKTIAFPIQNDDVVSRWNGIGGDCRLNYRLYPGILADTGR